MRKLVFLLLILISFYGNLFSQSCLPEGYKIRYQQDIDSFQVYHPNCTEIEGDVSIESYQIKNLYGLSVLTAIGGDLSIYICDSLNSLAGLENIDFIGGNLVITYVALTSMTGLDNLNFIGGDLEIDDIETLTSLTGLENLDSVGGDVRISLNPSLPDLAGLEGLTYSGGSLRIISNDALSSLEALNNLNYLGGDIEMVANAALTTLEGLNNIDTVRGYLKLYWTALTDLSGLENLTHIAGSFSLINNKYLVSLDALGNLASVGPGLFITGNDVLGDLSGFQNLNFVDGDLRVDDNDLLQSLAGLDNINGDSLFDLYIFSNVNLSTCEIESVCNYLAGNSGYVGIYNNNTGCNNREEVEEACGVGIDESAVSGRRRSGATSASGGSAVIIYPNPSADLIYIDIRGYKLKYQISIFDSQGQEILQLQASEPQTAVDVSGFDPGVYFVKIISDDGMIAGKFVKK